MSRTYEIHSGRRIAKTMLSSSPLPGCDRLRPALSAQRTRSRFLVRTRSPGGEHASSVSPSPSVGPEAGTARLASSGALSQRDWLEWLPQLIFGSKPGSRAPSLRSWTQSWGLSFGAPTVPSMTAGCALRHPSRTLRLSERMLQLRKNRQTMLDTWSRVTLNSSTATRPSL